MTEPPVKSDFSDIRYTRDFDHVLKLEREYLRANKHSHNQTGSSDNKVSSETSGLALSGGGIRSAAFCLGVLQYLAKHRLLGKFDYLSTVSGGGYIGSAMTWLLNKTRSTDEPEYDLAENFPFGTEQDPALQPLADPDELIRPGPKRLLNYLTNNGYYLTGGKKADYLALLVEACKALLSNLLVWAALVVGGLLLITAIASSLLNGFDGFLQFIKETLPDTLKLILKINLVFIFFLGVSISVYSYLYSTHMNPEENYSHLSRSKRAFLNCSLKYVSLFFVIVLTLLFCISGRKYLDEALAGAVLPLILSIVLRGYNKHISWLAPLIAGLSMLLFFLSTLWMYKQFINYSPINRNTVEFIPFLFRIGSLLVIFAILLGVFKNLNLTSFGSYYRDCLMRLFMPSEDSLARNMPIHSKQADTFPLHKIRSGPLHLINTFAILPDAGTVYANAKNVDALPSKQAFHKVSKYRGDNFVLSPVYCGSEYLGWEKSDEYMNQKMTLATAMAISAAAANPHGSANGKGILKNKLIALAMGIYNIRLGFWAPNPMNRSKIYSRFSKLIRKNLGYVPNHFSPGLREVFSFLPGKGGLDELSHYVQLSDGAHFANLGLYELFRRQCTMILCCDAAADPQYQFADLNNELQRAKEDFGLIIDLDSLKLDALMPREKKNQGYPHQTTFSDEAFVHIRYQYPVATDKEPVSGDLIILKTALIKEADFFIRAYESVQSDFPDQTTADQFFDKEQFEAYRRLGFTISEDTFSENKMLRLIEASEDLEQKLALLKTESGIKQLNQSFIAQEQNRLEKSLDSVTSRLKQRETMRLLLDIQ